MICLVFSLCVFFSIHCFWGDLEGGADIAVGGLTSDGGGVIVGDERRDGHQPHDEVDRVLKVRSG